MKNKFLFLICLLFASPIFAENLESLSKNAFRASSFTAATDEYAFEIFNPTTSAKTLYVGPILWSASSADRFIAYATNTSTSENWTETGTAQTLIVSPFVHESDNESVATVTASTAATSINGLIIIETQVPALTQPFEVIDQKNPVVLLPGKTLIISGTANTTRSITVMWREQYR